MDNDPIEMQAFDQINPFSQESLTELTSNRLRAMIHEGTLKPGTRLPNEHKLAEALGVSRGTLRSALHMLQQQGLIWRRQGMGSFISEKPILENRLDLNIGVTELIQSMGFTPGCKILEICINQADERMAEMMQVPVDTAMVEIRRIRTANALPVVASIDYFPLSILQQSPRPMDMDLLRQRLIERNSLYQVLEQDLHINIEYGIAKLQPVKVDAHFIKQFGLDLPKGSVMLYMEQIDFDRNRHPLNLSLEYHVADFCTFSVYRRR